ncbi:MAG: gamma-glutamyl-gamma-aminobutyrate hydrolase family protein [Candidatus Symbiobacter sp.]|nr:gamma-glutamyl-gamma-aminobutyrate hydrolase family protein [Candidatus Symbiobacter sp.]
MRPKIGIMCDVKHLEEYPFHGVGEEYLYAVMAGAAAWPVMIPALVQPTHTGRAKPAYDIDLVLSELDGLVLTGSYSCVAPRHYQAELAAPGILLDEQRDAISLELIRRALARGVPLLAICRGFQELNVALGGSLHQNIPALSGRQNHMPFYPRPPDEMFAPAHLVTVMPGGLVAELAALPTPPEGQNQPRQMWINSVHQQGIDRLASGLQVEAVADDGIIEAVTVADAPGFNLAVQWHPEFRFWDAEYWRTPLITPPEDAQPLSDGGFSQRLFAAFGQAAGEYAIRT